MAQEPDSQHAAQAAIDEVARTLSQSSRRTTEQAQQATRTLLDESAEISRNVFGAWASTGETLWRAAFKLQNAQLQAGLSWTQTLADNYRSAAQQLEQWDGVARQAQQAWLDLFQASARILARAADETVGPAHRRVRK